MISVRSSLSPCQAAQQKRKVRGAYFLHFQNDNISRYSAWRLIHDKGLRHQRRGREKLLVKVHGSPHVKALNNLHGLFHKTVDHTCVRVAGTLQRRDLYGMLLHAELFTLKRAKNTVERVTVRRTNLKYFIPREREVDLTRACDDDRRCRSQSVVRQVQRLHATASKIIARSYAVREAGHRRGCVTISSF